MTEATELGGAFARPAAFAPSPPLGLFGALARLADWASNRAERTDLPFHPAAEGMFLADLHCDTLLWGVDPWRRRQSGQVDLPRLARARVGLQVFAAPTWTPLPRREGERTVVSHIDIDQSSALFPFEGFGRARAAARRHARALKIAARFDEMTRAPADAPCRLVPVRAPADLDRLDAPGEVVGAMLALEGLHWLPAQADRAAVEAEIAALHAAGYRMIAPTHRFANGLGGASESVGRGVGLTHAGRLVIHACLDRDIVVDLAHGSAALIREAAGIALNQPDGPRPVIVSHAGVQAVHRTVRNLTGGDIRAVAATGGLIGVGFWRSAMGWADSDPFDAKMARITGSFAAALDALSEPGFVGEMEGRFGRYDPYEHLAFGSDFDGAVRTAFDVSGVSHVVGALADLRRGGEALFPRDKLPLIAGENARRVLRAGLGG